MDEGLEILLKAIDAIVVDTHPDKIRQFANLIRENGERGMVVMPSGWSSTPTTNEQLADLFDAWEPKDVSNDELAGMLIGASHAHHEAKARQSIELVWTGPSSALVSTRKTEQALIEVINSAKKELFLTSFVAYNVVSIISALCDAMTRGVAVSLLLESSDQHGGGLSVDSIAKMRESLPLAEIFYWKKKDSDVVDGKVHAKVAVADQQVCFISSANLTEHAMDKNMEAGVLIRGGQIPDQLHRHLKAMVTIGVVRPVFL